MIHSGAMRSQSRCGTSRRSGLRVTGRALAGLAPVLERRAPVLGAIELGMPDADPAVSFAHALERTRLARLAVMKPGGLDQSRMAPAVENDGGDVVRGNKPVRAESLSICRRTRTSKSM